MPTNVLIVDDLLPTCYLLTHCLAIIGVKSECADSGAAAFASMAKALPAMVFLDYMMPEMDGLEVLCRMKADDTLRTIPVVMFTANDTKRFCEEAMRLGARGVLIKGTANLKDFHRYVTDVMNEQQAEESHAVMIAGEAEPTHAIKVYNASI